MYHNKAYYVTINGIVFGKKAAQINVKINNDIIKITVQNVSGFTIEIPPQINKVSFKIIIHDVEFN
jgi:ribosomal protein L25 (general stress protein Ctc)